MKTENLLLPSTRVALAAYLHDLGKFSERARSEPDNNRINDHKHQYCPFHKEGNWFSHVHAAYTAMSFDLLEEYFPDIIGEDVYPFAQWGDPDVDNSLINAAARHHKPETALQWIVATADRVASGFERETFEAYNHAREDEKGKNHYQTRLLTLFEQISLDNDRPASRSELVYRYPLKAMSVQSLFPKKASDCEPDNNAQAQKEYKALWDGFVEATQQIPRSHQRLDLWLDHFDSLWQTYTHSIPSATAGKTRPDVSLYDHSRATAALAVALWRYHKETQHTEAAIIKGLKYRDDWDDKKLLLIQGDLFGIQNFIFTEGSQTNKKAAKLLRGRSFYVSLLTETAALKILETLGLPTTSQIINAAGKFLIVAPNTENVKQQLILLREEMNDWFREYTFAQTGIGIAWQSAACNQFVQSEKGDRRNDFSHLIASLFQQLESAKLQRFELCSNEAKSPLFSAYLDSFDNTLGNCPYNDKLPAQKIGNDICHPLSYDQIKVGEYLSQYERIIISRENLQHHTLHLPLFGYYINFTTKEEQSGKFGLPVAEGNIRRVWDFSLPKGDQVLFNGYARRNINTYVPLFQTNDILHQEKYAGLNEEELEQIEPGAIKTLTHIACEDKQPDLDNKHKWQGISALMILKGDVDNLGSIFEAGLKQPTFAKMASFSRQMNNFFAVILPDLCQTEFPHTYTVFAGGDDFFLIGPWQSQQTLVQTMAVKFADYVAQNREIHFSAGLLLTKPGIPIPYMAQNAEQALEQAKDFYLPETLEKISADRPLVTDKNAVTVFGRTLSWIDYARLLNAQSRLDELKTSFGLKSGYIYGLLQLCQMAEEAQTRPEKAIWYAWFSYRTARFCKDTLKLKDNALDNAINQLGEGIAINGIKQFTGDYQVVLYNHLYQLRD